VPAIRFRSVPRANVSGCRRRRSDARRSHSGRSRSRRATGDQFTRDGEAREARAADQERHSRGPMRCAALRAWWLVWACGHVIHGRRAVAARLRPAPNVVCGYPHEYKCQLFTAPTINEETIGATVVEGSNGLLLEIDGKIVPTTTRPSIPSPKVMWSPATWSGSTT